MRKKQIVMMMAAAAAALAIPMNVMASGSISGALDTNNVTAATETGAANVGGMDQMTTEDVGVTLSPVEADTYPEELQNQVDMLNNANGDLTLLDAFLMIYDEDELPQVDVYNGDGEVTLEDVDMSEFKFLSPVMELLLETEPTEENPVDVTFTANNMTDQIEVFVLHYCDGHEWEILEAEKISDNQLTAGFHSASPVALIYRELPEEETEVDTDVTAP